MAEQVIDKPLLDLVSMTGFSGGVTCGLKVHPDRQHLIFPVGCTIVVEEIKGDVGKNKVLSSDQQFFLSGHTNDVTCLAISRSGKYIASGQETHMGFKADVIIWDFSAREMYAKLTLHMVNVEALEFSPNDKYLVTLGGMDDGSVVVWNIATKQAICGAQAQVMSAGITKTIAFANCDEIFVTGGDNTLRVWELDLPNRKIRPSEVNMGNMKRVIKYVEFDDDDKFFYCGTTTGDILAVNMASKCCQKIGPKARFSLGVTALKLLKNRELLVGAGDGTICIVKSMEQDFKRTNKTAKLNGAVTSIALRGNGHQFYVGTDQCNIYRFNHSEFTHELCTTCHYACVNDIVFPYGSSDVFCTASLDDLRVWNTHNNKELLRIVIPNMICNALEIMKDGKTIISGWNDGRIRAFTPQSGKPLYTIEDAHSLGVTALATFSDCEHIVSGGKEGNVRVWLISRQVVRSGITYTTKQEFILKEHKAEVTSIKVTRNNKECVTSSTDGSCIIWSLVKRCRQQMIRVNTLFKYACYHPSEHQIITTGTDRKIGYFETFDGATIRELEASTGSINGMDISSDGKFFVSGGDDKLVKVWKYDEGEPIFIGIGHSASIQRVKISPNERFIVSVSADGAILKWRFPLD